MNNEPIVLRQHFDAPVEVVWHAITDRDQMRQWFFQPMTDFLPEIGFETQFDVECEGKVYLHQWKVTEVDSPNRIAYQWRYGGYPGNSLVLWELSETSEGTLLRFTHLGHETIQGDMIFSRENGVKGWTYFVQESLKSFLDRKDS